MQNKPYKIVARSLRIERLHFLKYLLFLLSLGLGSSCLDPDFFKLDQSPLHANIASNNTIAIHNATPIRIDVLGGSGTGILSVQSSDPTKLAARVQGQQGIILEPKGNPTGELTVTVTKDGSTMSTTTTTSNTGSGDSDTSTESTTTMETEYKQVSLVISVTLTENMNQGELFLRESARSSELILSSANPLTAIVAGGSGAGKLKGQSSDNQLLTVEDVTGTAGRFRFTTSQGQGMVYAIITKEGATENNITYNPAYHLLAVTLGSAQASIEPVTASLPNGCNSAFDSDNSNAGLTCTFGPSTPVFMLSFTGGTGAGDWSDERISSNTSIATVITMSDGNGVLTVTPNRAASSKEDLGVVIQKAGNGEGENAVGASSFELVLRQLSPTGDEGASLDVRADDLPGGCTRSDAAAVINMRCNFAVGSNPFDLQMITVGNNTDDGWSVTNTSSTIEAAINNSGLLTITPVASSSSTTSNTTATLTVIKQGNQGAMAIADLSYSIQLVQSPSSSN